METVLRKVSVKDRLPKEQGRYIFYIHEQNDLGLSKYLWNCYFDNESKEVFKNIGQAVIAEYWYEEVSVEELEDYKVAVGNLNLIIEMDALKAKERYEKALSDFNMLSNLEQALEISAGLKEDVV
jgi:hypothetical protein